jgi:hypothetical protein
VWSWRPWAGAKRAGDDPLVTVTMRSRTPGRARYKPYTIAQGRPADPVEPVVTNSCASLLHTRLRVQPASGLPCALCSFEGHRCRFPPGANVPREGGRVSLASLSLRAQRSNPEFFRGKALDCFVADAPRNDGELFEMLNQKKRSLPPSPGGGGIGRLRRPSLIY